MLSIEVFHGIRPNVYSLPYHKSNEEIRHYFSNRADKNKSSPFCREGLIVILGVSRFVRARLLLLHEYLYILNGALNTRRAAQTQQWGCKDRSKQVDFT